MSLNLTATLGQPSGPSALGTGGLSINQTNVASSLNNFFNSGGALPPAFVSVFGLTGGNLGNALSQLSGEAATGGQQAAFQLGNQFLTLMLDPFVDGRSGFGGTPGTAIGFAPEREAVPDEVALAYAAVLKAPKKARPQTFEQRWGVWGTGFGGSNRTNGDPTVLGSHDLSARVAGFAGGFDYRLTPNTVVGIALAGAGTDWSLAQGLGGGKSDAFQAGVYGVTRWDALYLAASFAYTNHWMSTDRFAFAGDHLTASFNAQSLGGRIEGGYRLGTVFGALTPYAAVQVQSFRTPSYSETDVNGGGFALAYNARTGTDTRSELGARFDRMVALNPTAALALRGRLAWAHDWVSDPTLAPLFQTLPGASFIVNGARAGEGLPRSPPPARSFASPTASRCSASSTASSPAAPPPMPAPARSATLGEAARTANTRSARVVGNVRPAPRRSACSRLKISPAAMAASKCCTASRSMSPKAKS